MCHKAPKLMETCFDDHDRGIISRTILMMKSQVDSSGRTEMAHSLIGKRKAAQYGRREAGCKDMTSNAIVRPPVSKGL